MERNVREKLYKYRIAHAMYSDFFFNTIWKLLFPYEVKLMMILVPNQMKVI